METTKLSFFHNLSRVFLINLIVLGCLALLTDLIFGNWIFGPNFGNLNIPRKMTRYFDTSSLYPGGGKILYVRDKYGLRGEYDNLATLDILVMGGSTTDEKFTDEGKTWVDVLRSRFVAEGNPMQVVNAAIDGHSTFGHIWSFNMWFPLISNFHARYVLAFIGINDVAAINPNRYDLMKSGDWQRRLRYYFVNNSALYNLYRTIRGNIRARNAHLIHGGGKAFGIKWIEACPQPDLETARHKIRERLEAYGERIKIFSKKIRGFGAQPIFVTQPRGDYRIRNGKVFGKKKEDGTANVNSYINITLYNKELMMACAEVEAICIDLADGFSFANGDVYDHIHTTPQGSRKIGEAIYELLKPHITAPETGSH